MRHNGDGCPVIVSLFYKVSAMILNYFKWGVMPSYKSAERHKETIGVQIGEEIAA